MDVWKNGCILPQSLYNNNFEVATRFANNKHCMHCRKYQNYKAVNYIYIEPPKNINNNIKKRLQIKQGQVDLETKQL